MAELQEIQEQQQESTLTLLERIKHEAGQRASALPAEIRAIQLAIDIEKIRQNPPDPSQSISYFELLKPKLKRAGFSNEDLLAIKQLPQSERKLKAAFELSIQNICVKDICDIAKMSADGRHLLLFERLSIKKGIEIKRLLAIKDKDPSGQQFETLYRLLKTGIPKEEALKQSDKTTEQARKATQISTDSYHSDIHNTFTYQPSPPKKSRKKNKPTPVQCIDNYLQREHITTTAQAGTKQKRKSSTHEIWHCC